ncbi:MAG: tetratricopeptide repeat protein [Clostridiales bacterium]|jgi:Tfp pilus assembly protein PilF|nr:tetratricopeptide repeat protein [Clostridiales bacterium]
MTRRIKRNLIIFGVGIGLYALFAVFTSVLHLDIWVVLLAYAAIGALAYFLNRKNIWALRGNYFYVTGHAERARPLLKRALEGGVKSPAAHIYYALLLVKEDKNANEAFKYLDRALEYATNVVDERSAYITMATCHYMNNDAQAAINVLEGMREKHEYVNTSALVTLGYLYIQTGELDKALEMSNLAIEDDANYASAWDNLGQIYFKQEDFSRARNAFEQALSLKESLADSNYFMGIICEQEGEKEQAAEYFRKAAISPFAFFNSITQEQADAKYNEYHED